MSVSSSVQEQPVQAPEPPAAEHGRPLRHRRRAFLLAAAGLVVVAGVAVALSDPFGGSSRAGSGVRDNGTPTSLAAVKRGTLSQQVNSSGTLGYVAQPDGSPYQVVNQASGALTELPAAGQVIGCGQVLYRVANNPVVLLCGSTPAYRSLSEGDSGPDVKELNANLVRLGYATRSELDPSSDYFGSETAAALERLQAKLGVDQTGSLSLGQAVFLPGPLRIAQTTAALGSLAHPGAPVAQATSTRRQVQVDLDASQQSSIKVGEQAQVTLPDNHTTPGTVTGIGTVASSSGSAQSGSSGSGSGSGSSSTTIPVYVTLKHPTAAGSLDQAPVQVQIITSGVKDALIVPANALIARSGGGYAVETVDARGVHHLVPVTVGLFDDADGLVQVTGALTPGEHVVVPST
jgi:hypothetical protein